MERCGDCDHWQRDSPVPWSDYRRCQVITTDQGDRVAFIGVDNLAGELLTREDFGCTLWGPRTKTQDGGRAGAIR